MVYYKLYVLKKQGTSVIKINLFACARIKDKLNINSQSIKKEQNLTVLLFIAKSFSCCDDLFAIVVTALSAHMMRHLGLVALGARNEARSLKLPVGTAAVATSLGHLTLWNCHVGYTSFKILNQSSLSFINCCNAARRGSGTKRSQPQSPSLRSAPQTGQRPLQSDRQRLLSD